MTSAAHDELNELLRDKDRSTAHPEDQHADSDHSEPESEQHHEHLDTDDELDLPADMRSNYYLPSIRSEANTGPKGVIADAHAFEKAKKQARRFTWKKSPSPETYQAKIWHDDKSSDEDGEDTFLKQWREARLQELHNVGQRIRSRTTSPSRRIYGNFPDVDGEGYLEAIEKVARDTVVVVFIYDSSSETSQMVEECMQDVARRNDTTRFVKMRHQIAELDTAGVPAVLAYRNAEQFASLVPLLDELQDADLSPLALETCLRRHRILH